MADLLTRDDWEAELARRFGSRMRANLRQLMAHLGDPPSMDDVPAEFWTQMEADLASEFEPVFYDIAIESAEQMLGDTPLGVEWGLVNESAATFAREHTFNLVTQITDSQRRDTQEWISRFFSDGLTMDELGRGLSRAYGPVRAELIASTEVTRAAVEGEIGFMEELVRSGVPVQRQWQTSMDESVCPVCAPLNEQVQSWGMLFEHPDGRVFEKPPAHPRCRCWLNYDVTTEGFNA